MPHTYSQEQREFIETNYKGISNLELTNMFNSRFELDLKVSQIKSYKRNHKFNSGLDGRFKPGQVPVNKGTKGLTGANRTSFKKGHVPHNHVPVGSERINCYGYLDVKIAEPNKWKGKHRLIWEKANGKIPKGYNVIFADGNKRNLNIVNLILVSWSKLLIMNRNNLIKTDAKLTKTGAIIADLYKKINEKSKK